MNTVLWNIILFPCQVLFFKLKSSALPLWLVSLFTAALVGSYMIIRMKVMPTTYYRLLFWTAVTCSVYNQTFEISMFWIGKHASYIRRPTFFTGSTFQSVQPFCEEDLVVRAGLWTTTCQNHKINLRQCCTRQIVNYMLSLMKLSPACWPVFIWTISMWKDKEDSLIRWMMKDFVSIFFVDFWNNACLYHLYAW